MCERDAVSLLRCLAVGVHRLFYQHYAEERAQVDVLAKAVVTGAATQRDQLDRVTRQLSASGSPRRRARVA